MNKIQIAQGDLLIEKIETIPENLTAVKSEDNHVLAHSETGHHHIVSAEKVNYYPANDEFFGYLDVKQEAQIIHLRGFDTHAPINLKEGKYKVTRQREYTPQGYRRVLD